DKLNGYTPIILENGTLQLSANKDSLGLATIKGTPQNDYFADYMEKSRGINSRAMSIQDDLQKATMQQDQAVVNSLTDEMNDLTEELKSYELSYIKENPNALISVLLMERVIGARLLPADEVQTLFDGLSPEIKETSAAKKISEQLNLMKERMANEKNTDIGSKAPAFSGPTPDGSELALVDAMGKVTLIDFWAAWCRPCRAENPNVVKVYEKYHAKGLNIIGVSLDKKDEDWKKAITDDGLTWHQISNLAYFNDPIAKLYNVDAIPAAFLIDENGVIVGKNLRGAALEAKVAELLN
ncbi:MAG: TlpA disulfide reductase family protein, partial [Flavobacteriaceae bacterium]